MIEMIYKKFGKITISRGENHKCMGMDIEFWGNGRISLFMKDCTDETIASFSKYMDAKVSSPY